MRGPPTEQSGGIKAEGVLNKQFLLLVLAAFGANFLLHGCGKASSQLERSPHVALPEVPDQAHSNERMLSYEGEIDAEMLSAIRSTAGAIDFLEMTSHGGDMMIAMEIAELVDAHDITLVVKDYCFSACAHFLTLPVDQLIITDEAVIGFHHTSATLLIRAWRPLMLETPRFRELSETYVEKQVAFFQREGIDQRWLFEADIRTSPICTYLGIVQGPGPLVNYENEFDFLVLTNSVLQAINPDRDRLHAQSEMTEEKLNAFKQRHTEYADTKFLLSNDPVISVTETDVGALQKLPLCDGSLFSK